MKSKTGCFKTDATQNFGRRLRNSDTQGNKCSHHHMATMNY